MNTTAVMFKAIFFTAVFAVLGLSACGGSAVNENGIDITLLQITEEANKSLPLVIDEQTRLDMIEVLPGNTIKFNTVLFNKANEEIEIGMFKESMRPAMLSNVKTNPSLDSFRKKGVTFVYRYSDKNGEETAVFEYTPEDYK
jgi:hypothetical protein